MNINRHNYEEYFLLYTDNELSAGERQAVEAFIQQHPDLQKELAMLQQATLLPDERIVFANKEVLMQGAQQAGFINEENYQEIFVLYFDDELQKDQKTAVEKFVYDHPQYQEEFELIQSLKLNPDLSISFPDKNSLFRHPETRAKRVIFTWGRIAVAASVLIFAGIVWLAQSRTSLPGNLAQTNAGHALKPRPVESTTVIPELRSLGSEQISVSPPPSLFQQNDVARSMKRDHKEKVLVAANSTNTPHTGKVREDRSSTIKSENKLARVTEDVQPRQPEISKTTEPDPTNNDVAAHATRPSSPGQEVAGNTPLIHTLVNNQQSNQVSDIAMTADDNSDNISVAGFSLDKKSSIRGLLRKASRFIDKTTSIRPVKKQGLVIGNIEIALQ